MRVHVEITGRVQGVFFRDSCRTEALRRGVHGWVRNTPAGTVEAEFEGEPQAVDEGDTEGNVNADGGGCLNLHGCSSGGYC